MLKTCIQIKTFVKVQYKIDPYAQLANSKKQKGFQIKIQ